MSTRPKYDDFDDAGGDLENSLNAIGDIAEILAALEGDPLPKTAGSTPKAALEYLAARLREHRDEAMDAFSRIYGLDGCGKEEGEDAEKGGAA
jgi:hypothetical protein